MASERYEIRLDSEHKKRLRELSAAYGVPGSTLLKNMIDRLYIEQDRRERRAAAERIGRMEIEDVPEPEELSRQLAETHEPGIR